jgi:hypothetical protein
VGKNEKDRVAAALFGLVLWGFGVSLAGTRKDVPITPFAPRIEPGSAVRLDGPVLVAGGKNSEMRLRLLGDAERLRFLEDKAGASVDPFAGAEGRPERFLTFLVQIENRETGALVFQAESCRIVLKDNDELRALDVTAIESAFGLVGHEMPDVFRPALGALFNRQVVLQRGERAFGLLAFRSPGAKTKSFTLHVEWTLPSGEPASFAMPFAREGERSR